MDSVKALHSWDKDIFSRQSRSRAVKDEARELPCPRRRGRLLGHEAFRRCLCPSCEYFSRRSTTLAHASDSHSPIHVVRRGRIHCNRLIGIAALFTFVFHFAPVTHAGTELQPNNRPVKKAASPLRVSRAALLKVVRDFRVRLGKDEGLYYLVNPPGGVTEEERAEVENEIVYFLLRVHKDPTLDFPSKWLKELRDYTLTPVEWDTIERHFTSALTFSSLSAPVRHSLSTRFNSLRTQVLATPNQALNPV